jgi:ABC-type sulfate/molybdate transport systems ATPase subunit
MALTDVIRVEGLRKQFAAEPVLHNVNLSIRRGEHTAVLGESGSGKSTLLRLLAALETPTAGEIWIAGRLSSRAGSLLTLPHQRDMGMVFQDLALWPNLTVLGNVVLGLAAARLSRGERTTRAIEALTACGLRGFEDRRPASLSVGQQQRVAFARALAVRPKWLLLDEPFASLDLVLKAHLIAELHHLIREFDCTLVLVTHEPDDARSLCSQVLLLERGQIRESGRWDEVLAQPQSALLQLYKDRQKGASRSNHAE